MKKRDKENGINLSAMSTKGRRKRKSNALLITVNILCSFVLVLSIIALSGMLMLSARPFDVGQDTPVESGNYEPIKVSTFSQVSYVLVVGLDESEKLTDIIMVMCIDHEKDTVNILQIPRDTFIGTDVPTKKINAVYGNPRKGEANINALRRRIGTHLGIPLDHYVIFTLKGFRNVVDALGGVEINISQKNGLKIEDHTTHKFYTIGPGPVKLNGVMAEGFIRKRYGSEEGYGKGDISRVEAQRIFYAALVKKLKNMNFSQISAIVNKCLPEVKTSMSLGEILGYAKELMGIDMSNIRILTVPGQGCTYRKVSYYSIHKDDYIKLFNTYMNPYGEPLTASDIKIRELHKEIGQPTYPSLATQGGTLEEISEKTGQ
ncbi:MAG TPA: LCP family protein [Clostridiales bacterium]|nr:LCP family protein [Clostridiales bacterium]